MSGRFCTGVDVFDVKLTAGGGIWHLILYIDEDKYLRVNLFYLHSQVNTVHNHNGFRVDADAS
jgi:hypothetical protein